MVIKHIAVTMDEFHRVWLNRHRTGESFFIRMFDQDRQITDVGVPIFNIGAFLVDVEGLGFALNIPVNASINITVKN